MKGKQQKMEKEAAAVTGSTNTADFKRVSGYLRAKRTLNEGDPSLNTP